MRNGIYVLISMNTENNSVKEKCTEESKISEYRLLFNSPLLEKKVLVIVEGLTDKVYKFFFDDEKVLVRPNNSCDGLLKLIDELNKNYKNRFIVIKDADFDHLNSITYEQYENLFLTDSHDVETMMLSVSNVERKLLVEFLPSGESNFISECMKHLEPLSYLKWFNITNQLNLIVRGIKIGTVYCGDKHVSLENCKDELYKIPANQERCPCVLDDLKEFIKNNKTDDEWNLVNGHDLCTGLNVYIKKHGGSGGDISMYIRAAYTFEDFKKSKLYQDLRNWESIHGREIFLNTI